MSNFHSTPSPLHFLSNLGVLKQLAPLLFLSTKITPTKHTLPPKISPIFSSPFSILHIFTPTKSNLSLCSLSWSLTSLVGCPPCLTYWFKKRHDKQALEFFFEFLLIKEEECIEKTQLYSNFSRTSLQLLILSKKILFKS